MGYADYKVAIPGGYKCLICGKEIVMKDKSKRQGIGFMSAYMNKHLHTKHSESIWTIPTPDTNQQQG